METQNFHIGQIVERAFNQSGMSKSDFAKSINVRNQNINREFKKADWSVIKLIEAGKVLDYDFSYLFSSKKEQEPQKTEVTLQVKVADVKINEVLRYIDDKNLYNLLK